MKLPPIIQGFEGQAPLEFLETVSRALGDAREVESDEEYDEEDEGDGINDTTLELQQQQNQNNTPPADSSSAAVDATSAPNTPASSNATFGGLMRNARHPSDGSAQRALPQPKMSKKARRMAAAGRQLRMEFADEQVTRGTRGWGRRAVRRRENLRFLAAQNRPDPASVAAAARGGNGAAPTPATPAAVTAEQEQDRGAEPGSTERELSGATRSYFRQVFESPGALELWTEFSEAPDASQDRYLKQFEKSQPEQNQGDSPQARYSALDRNTRQLLRSMQASGKVLLAEIEMQIVNGLRPLYTQRNSADRNSSSEGADAGARTIAATPGVQEPAEPEWVVVTSNDVGDGTSRAVNVGDNDAGGSAAAVSAEHNAAATGTATTAAAAALDCSVARQTELDLVDKYDRRLAHAIAKFHMLESFSETTSQGARRTKVVAPAGSRFGVQGTLVLLADYLASC